MEDDGEGGGGDGVEGDGEGVIKARNFWTGINLLVIGESDIVSLLKISELNSLQKMLSLSVRQIISGLAIAKLRQVESKILFPFKCFLDKGIFKLFERFCWLTD